MKLNCDLGESFGQWQLGQDDALMPLIDQANIACGFHAGDPCVIANTLALAKQNTVAIGAHPSYPDLQGFGRRSMKLSDDELIHGLHYQISALDGMASIQGLTLGYVKPHGALYNDMMSNEHLRKLIMQAVAAFPKPLKLMLQATQDHAQHNQEATQFKLDLMFEAFADRAYTDDGKLVSRNKPNAVLSEDAMLAQVKRLVERREIVTENQHILSLPVDTLCIHGDNPTAVTHAKTIRAIIHAG